MSFLEFVQQNSREILALAGEHLFLVFVSIGLAVAVGIPLGILLTRRAALKRPVLAVANVMQTVPSLALFALLIPLPKIGIGWRPAVIALFLYSLLPIIRNTVTGIEGVDRNIREAAVAMGMTDGQVLRQVELPLATPVILAGVRVAAVISVGVATVAAAIGAGGLGMYIFRGLRQYDNNLLLAGAVPAALLALAADAGIGLIESQLAARRRGEQTNRKTAFIARGAIAVGVLAAALIGGSALLRGSSGGSFVVGSKDFSESILLGELYAQMLEARGVTVERKYELGGNLPHDSIVAGKLDAYPEYTGTSFTAILKHAPITDPRAVYDQVKREYEEKFELETSAPLGFSNDYAILVRSDDARRLNLRTISDAVPHARNWRAGFGQDFMSRADGYAGLARAYNLQLASRPREMDLSLSYRALADGEVDVIAGNSTDGMIGALGLTQLEDDRHYFPPYESVFVVRRDALERYPKAREVLQKLAGAITTEEMRKLNYEVDGKKRSAADVIREYLKARCQMLDVRC